MSASGRVIGGKPFSRGALYLMLQNRLYRGEIVHKGRSHPGEHPPIIDQPLWNTVQEQLAVWPRMKDARLGKPLIDRLRLAIAPSSCAWQLRARGPAPGSLDPGSASGACFVGPRFPWSPALAPPTPPPVARLCSSASSLPCRSRTSLDRASAASAPAFPLRTIRPQQHLCPIQRSPGSRARSVRTCQGLRPRRVWRALRNDAPASVAAFRGVNNVGTRVYNAFAAQWLAYTLPYRRFAVILAEDCARIGGDVGCYSFIAVDSHHILLAGLPAHSRSQGPALWHAIQNAHSSGGGTKVSNPVSSSGEAVSPGSSRSAREKSRGFAPIVSNSMPASRLGW